MVRDEALLADGHPTLRMYGWTPAAVSLGRSQSPDAVDTEVARELGADIVQRATGGGAILHEASEVTYSVVLPLDFEGMPADIPGSFSFLSTGVRSALRALGVDAEFEFAGSARADEPLCYLRRQGTNILVGARKISGGAQRRTRTHVLQHGTVIVTRDPARYARLFRCAVDEVESGVTSLRDEGVTVSREALIDALVTGYADAFTSPLTISEYPPHLAGATIPIPN